MTVTENTDHLRAHYSLRHRITARVSTLLDSQVYTIRHGLAKGLRRRGGLGWLPGWVVGAGRETPETSFLANLDLRDKVVFDIGGFQGMLSMFFARQAKHVVVYEPNPSSRARLQENLALNGFTNVTVRPVGVGERHEELEFVFDPLMAGGASASASIAAQIRSSAKSLRVETIDVVSLDKEVADGVGVPDFVKIDVEGMELDVLKGMRKVLQSQHPTLYIEMHGATVEEKRANARVVVDELFSNGYTNLLHIETKRNVTPEISDTALRGHLYCSCA
jgi:FkbM family methyltransferase